jgi:hypothetical protein
VAVLVDYGNSIALFRRLVKMEYQVCYHIDLVFYS